MPTIISDLIEQSSISVGDNGLTITRVMLIDGVTGSASQRLINAISDPGIPKKYDSYPSQTGLYCKSVNGVPADSSNTKFFITAVYETMTADQAAPSATTPAKLTISTSLQEIETTRDKDGNVITLNYHALNDTTNLPKTGTVKAQKMILVLTYTRKEPSVPNLALYADRVNVAAIFGYPARTLLFAHANAEVTSDQAGVMMTYEFHYKEDTWDVLVLANDPATGQPYTNINPLSGDNNGYKIVQIKKTADFTGLALA